MRAVRPPNIADLTRRGGLTDPGAVPYTLGAYAGQWYLSASAVGTPTVSQYVILGFAQEVGDARYFCLEVEPNATPDLIAEKFPNLAFAEPEWVKKNIIEKHIADDHLEMGHELFDVLASKVRRLQAWPPPGHDNRTFRVAQGEIACRVLAELKHFNKACRREQLPLDRLREQFGPCTTWKFQQRLNPAQNKSFQRWLDGRGRWKADSLYEGVAILMGAGSYATVRDWCKEFRRWQRNA